MFSTGVKDESDKVKKTKSHDDNQRNSQALGDLEADQPVQQRRNCIRDKQR